MSKCPLGNVGFYNCSQSLFSPFSKQVSLLRPFSCIFFWSSATLLHTGVGLNKCVVLWEMSDAIIAPNF